MTVIDEKCPKCSAVLEPGGNCYVCEVALLVTPHSVSNELRDEERDLYTDVQAFLAGGLPDPPSPVLLRRDDGHAIFYDGQVNLLFGDPECGKTMIAQAAAVEALNDGRRVLCLDLDHNGPAGTFRRLLDLGVSDSTLGNRDLFRYVEPEDEAHLTDVVADARKWRPAVAVVDSVGELLPLLRLSSNSPDDFTVAHARVLKPLAMAGAAVLAIDHLPKNPDSRASGPTGTAAKRRAIGGASIRVTAKEPFTPGRGGSAYLAVNKDRGGGLRRHCHAEGKEPAAGLFILEPKGDDLSWRIRPPVAGDTADALNVAQDDLAALDQLDPPPTSVTDVRHRLKWGNSRAMEALRAWRDRNSRTGYVTGERVMPRPDGRNSLPTQGGVMELRGDGDPLCAACGEPMLKITDDQTVHPGCSVAP